MWAKPLTNTSALFLTSQEVYIAVVIHAHRAEGDWGRLRPCVACKRSYYRIILNACVAWLEI